MILNFLTHSNRSDICSKPVYFISCYHTYRKANCEIPVRQTRKPLYAIGVSVRPPPAWRISFQLMTYICKKDSPIVEKAYVETFVITQYNRPQTALYNEKLSSFNFNSSTCYPHIIFYQYPLILPLLATASFRIISVTLNMLLRDIQACITWSEDMFMKTDDYERSSLISGK